MDNQAIKTALQKIHYLHHVNEIISHVNRCAGDVLAYQTHSSAQTTYIQGNAPVRNHTVGLEFRGYTFPNTPDTCTFITSFDACVIILTGVCHGETVAILNIAELE